MQIPRVVPIPRFLVRLLAPLAGLLSPHVPVENPWERSSAVLPPRAFGRGAVRDFRWYFERESQCASRRSTRSATGCWAARTSATPELFNEADVWQHPGTFERLRQGDCEDYALWAWRKLVKLGVDAELVSGRWDVTRADAGPHAWVVFREGDAEFLLEAVARTRVAMVRPLADVRAQYRPARGGQRAVRDDGVCGGRAHRAGGARRPPAAPRHAGGHRRAGRLTRRQRRPPTSSMWSSRSAGSSYTRYAPARSSSSRP